MKTTAFFQFYEDTFSPADQKNISESLKLDPIIWDAFTDLPTVEKIVEKFGNSVTAWNLGAICLNYLGLSETILTKPFAEKLYLRNAVNLLESIRSGADKSLTLKDATYLALAIYERSLKSNNWEGLLAELGLSHFASRSKFILVWRTPLAILFSFLKNSEKLLAEIASNSDEYLAISLVNHIVAIQILNKKEKATIIKHLVENSSIERQISWYQSFPTQLGFLVTDLANYLGQPAQIQIGKEQKNLGSYKSIEEKIRENLLLGYKNLLDGADFQAETHFKAAKELTQKLQNFIDYNFIQTDKPLNPTGLEFADPIYEDIFISSKSEFSSVEELKNTKADAKGIILKLASLLALKNAGEGNRARELASREFQLWLRDRKSNWPAFDEIELLQKIDHKKIIELLKLLESNENIEVYLSFLEEISKNNPVISPVLINNIDQIANAETQYKKYKSENVPEALKDEIKKNLMNLLVQKKDWDSLFTEWKQAERKGHLLPGDWFDYANAACNAGKLEEAKEICQKLSQNGLDKNQLLSITGKIQFLEGNFEGAKTSIEESLKNNTGISDSWLTLAEIYEQMGDNDQAIATLRSAVLAVPGSNEIHYALARVCLRKNLFAEALPYLRKAIALNPEDESYHVDLVNTLKELGHLDEAQKLLLKARIKWPLNRDLAYLDAKHNLENGNHEQALAALQIAVNSEQNTPAEWQLLYAKTLLNDSENQFSLTESNAIAVENLISAQKALQTVVKANGSELNYANVLLAEVLYLLNEYESSHSIYLDLINRKDDNSYVLDEWDWRISAGMGMVKVALKEIEMGLVLLKDAIVKKPNHIGIKQVLAEQFWNAKLSGEAEQTARDAYNAGATDVRNLLWYANFMKKVGQNEEVIKALEDANLLSTDNPELSIRLASEYVAGGKIQEANSTLEQVLNEEINDYDILRKLTTTFMRLGNHQNAYLSYKKALSLFSPLSIENELELVYLCQINANWQEVLDHVQKLISQNYTFAATFTIQAHSLIGLQQYSAAINAFEQSLQSKRKIVDYLKIKNVQDFFVPLDWLQTLEQNEVTLTKLASCAVQANEFEKSLKCINQVIQLRPENPSYILFAADISMQLNDFDSAENYISQTGKIKSVEIEGIASSIQSGMSYLCNRFLRKEINKSDSNAEVHNLLSVLVGILQNSDNQEFQAKRSGFLSAAQRIPAEVNLNGKTQTDLLLAQPYRNMIYRLVVLSALDIYEYQQAWQFIEDWKAIGGSISEISLYSVLVIKSYEGIEELFKKTNVSEHLSSELHKKMQDESLLNSLMKKATQQGKTEFTRTFDQIVSLQQEQNIDYLKKLLNSDDFIPTEKFFIVDRLMKVNQSTLIEEYITSGAAKNMDFLMYANHIVDTTPLRIISFFNEIAIKVDPLVDMMLCKAFIAMNDVEDALTHCKNALTAWPEENNWKTLNAQLLEKAGHHEQASQLWEKILEETKSKKEVIYPYLDSLLTNGKVSDVHNLLEQHKKELSTSFEYYFMQARAFYIEGKNEQALQAIQRAKEIEPNNLYAEILEGNIYLECSQFEKARQNAMNVVKTDPSLVDGHLLLIAVHERQAHFQEAIRVAEKALIATPGNHALLMSKAWNLRQVGNLVDALNIASQLSVSNPEDWEALSLLTLIYNDMEDYRAAEESAKKSLRIVMDQPGILMLLGQILRRQGHLDQALEYFSKAAAINTEDIESCLEIGDVYLDQQNYPSALDAYHEAIERNEKDSRAYQKAGLIMKEVKDYQGAEKMLRIAADLSPKDVNIRRHLAGVIALNFVHSPLEAK